MGNADPVYIVLVQLLIHSRMYYESAFPLHCSELSVTLLPLLSGPGSVLEQCKHFQSVITSVTGQKLHRYSVNGAKVSVLFGGKKLYSP